MLYFIYFSFEKVHQLQYLFFLKRQAIENLDRIHTNLDRMDSCTLKSKKKIPRVSVSLTGTFFLGLDHVWKLGAWFTNQKSMRFKAKTVKHTRGPFVLTARIYLLLVALSI